MRMFRVDDTKNFPPGWVCRLVYVVDVPHYVAEISKTRDGWTGAIFSVVHGNKMSGFRGSSLREVWRRTTGLLRMEARLQRDRGGLDREPAEIRGRG